VPVRVGSRYWLTMVVHVETGRMTFEGRVAFIEVLIVIVCQDRAEGKPDVFVRAGVYFGYTVRHDTPSLISKDDETCASKVR
jgi:hypothetical protein